MCYHQARSARFIGHCWGRGWRDATENLLQTSIINRLGSFPLRRICGTERTTFIPLCESFQVGDSVAWGRGRGAEKTQTNKQNKGSKLQQQSNDDSRESWQALFFFVLETRINKKKRERDHGRLWTNPHYYTNALHEKRWYARIDAPHSFRR